VSVYRYGEFFCPKIKEKLSPEISNIIKEINPINIETMIRKLVSFGTRNTISEQDNPTRGIGTARDWIYGEFQRISTDCGGCLSVNKQTIWETTNPRRITSYVATYRE
jgi:hypothetical protein